MNLTKQLIALFALALMTFPGAELFAQGTDCNTAQSVTPGTYTADGPATGGGALNLCFGTGTPINADWYVYTPGASGSIDVYSCNGGTDTRLSIYQGSCAALTCVNNNDDACPTGTGSNFASEVLGMPVTAGTDYYIEWDDRWSTAGFDWTLDFICGSSPQSSHVVNLDCANNQFFIDVTVTMLGSATSVDIVNNAGAPTISGVGLGTHTIGPFPLFTTVQYQVVNLQDPGCDSFSPFIDHFPCPIVSCGPDNYQYCYASNIDSLAVYQGNTGFPLAMIFNSGTVDASDPITIYDGADANAPILFQGNNGGDMTGVTAVSTNAGNYLTLRHTSDGFSDCATSGGFYTPVNYDVACLNCTNPGGQYSVVTDCIKREWYVEVQLDSTGSAATADIVNTYNNDTLFSQAAGTIQVGPFPMDTAAAVTVISSDNPLCRQNGPSLIALSDSCTIVSCGLDSYNYCYENDDDAWFTFRRDTVNFGTGPITVTFIDGDMMDLDDRVIIYNGKDDQASNFVNSNFGGNFAGQSFNSTNPEGFLTVRFISGNTGSCDDGQVSQDIQFEVACGSVGIDEINEAVFSVYPNPANEFLNIALGQDAANATIRIYDALGGLKIESAQSFSRNEPVQLNTSGLSTGNYLIQVVSEGVFKVQRFQINR